MVCVVTDAEGYEHVVNVVVGSEDQDLHLFRDQDGIPYVYDELMNRLPGEDSTVIEAVSEAEDREWPDPTRWELGRDARREPGLYDPVPEDTGESGLPLAHS